MPGPASSSTRFLPHTVVATFAVIVLPAVAVSFLETSGRPSLVLVSVLLAMAISVAAASVGSAIWVRRPGSRDIVFADLMLWGWLRRVRAERRLAEARGLLGTSATSTDGVDRSRDRRCEVLQQLAAMLEAKDPYTLGHSRRVTRHSERIARELGVAQEHVARIRIAASVHDVGKVHTPRQILTKPGSLTDEELAIVKRHSADGAEMVAELRDPAITAMVRHHHERLDGSGYPDGLAREDIPLGARIISVADTFDALTSNRPYHRSYKHRRALDVLSEEAGTRLDADAVAAFLRYYSGRTGVAWSAFGVAAPPRLMSWVSGLLNSVGGWTAPLTQSIAAIVAAALAGASLAGQGAPATAASEPAAPGATPDSEAGDARAGGRAGREPSGQPVPVSDRRETESERDLRDGPGDRSNGRPAPPGGSDGTSPDNPPPPVPTAEPPTQAPPTVAPPDIQVPDIGVPDIDVPDVDVPSIQLPSAEVPLGELSDVSGVELPGVQLPNGAPD